jgi:predicted enzyme related to lactoylglutathione lyase
MSIRTSPWPAGIPCWADLTVADVTGAKAFYAAVLGWAFQDTEADYGGYAIAEVRGAAAAGIGPLPHEGAQSAWTVYLAGDDVDQLADAVAAHGGTVLLAPGDVGPLGRMFVAADPSGAVFGVWQAGTQIGAGVVNEPGGLTWVDLRTFDPDAARAFYSAVFGYVVQPLPDVAADYAIFALPGEGIPLGGMGGMMGAEGHHAHWLVYFGVADLQTATAAAEIHGGSVLMRDLDSPYGHLAAIRDPAGAAFWVVQADSDRMPDRAG